MKYTYLFDDREWDRVGLDTQILVNYFSRAAAYFWFSYFWFDGFFNF